MAKIILFDGVCNLCNSSVQFIIKRDKSATFKFASLQSEIGQMLLNKHKLNTKLLDSIVYIAGDKVYQRSSAILEITKELDGLWKLNYGLIIIPKFIRDFVYNSIAKSRYKLFGKREYCLAPNEDLKARFL